MWSDMSSQCKLCLRPLSQFQIFVRYVRDVPLCDMPSKVAIIIIIIDAVHCVCISLRYCVFSMGLSSHCHLVKFHLEFRQRWDLLPPPPRCLSATMVSHSSSMSLIAGWPLVLFTHLLFICYMTCIYIYICALQK